MEKMKKIISLAASAVLLMSSAALASAETKPTKWEFGTSEPIVGQDGSAQGQNGWYFMWSPETNKGGNLDVSKIKECVASETGSAWFAWGTGYLVGGNKGWLPDIYAADDYDAWGSNNWWLQNIDGTMNPAVVSGAKATSVLGFKAPASGKYSFNLTYEAGNESAGDNNDGLTVSINTKAGKLYSKATSSDKKDSENTTVTAYLKADEMIYFSADPNATGDNDVAKFNVKAEKVGKYVDNKTVWAFGDNEQDGSAQGQNGWYFMWSSETNKAGNLDISKIKECVASETGSAWFAWGTGYLVGGNKGWIPDIYAADDYNAWDSNNWWLQNIDGTMNPAVVTGQKATSVLGFKAPKSGEYIFDLTYKAGNETAGDNNDGVTVSINIKDAVLFKHAASSQQADTGTKSVTVKLKAGDMIYFTADPNATGDNDIANIKVVAEALSFDQDESTTKATTTTANNEDSPSTGENAPLALVGLAAAAGVTVFSLKKKKA